MNTGLNLADLRTEAKSLGINFEETWSPQRLQREIQAKKAEKTESETPNPMGSLNEQGELTNVGSTADPVYQHKEE